MHRFINHLAIISILIIISPNVIKSLKQSGEGRQEGIPTLGRTIHLGDMYSKKTGKIMAGLSLWDTNTINNNKLTKPDPHGDTKVIIENEFEDRANLFKLDATVRMEFLAGMVSVSGSANFLLDEKKTDNKVRVVGAYYTVNRTETLAVGKMASLVQYNRFCSEIPDVTHVVSSVTYGQKAIFTFEKEERDISKRQELGGKLKAIVKVVPTFSLDGQIEGSFKEKVKEIKQGMSIKFNGDFNPRYIPSTFEEALKFLYVDIPKNLHEHEPVITRFQLQPLSLYCDNANKLLHEISEQKMHDITAILEELRKSKRRVATLLDHPVAKEFNSIKEPLRAINVAVKKKEIEIRTKLKTLLPEMRGSGDGTKLEELILDHIKSPVRKLKLDSFLDRREREIHSINNWIANAKSQGSVILDEQRFARDNKCLVRKRYSLTLELNVLPHENIAKVFLSSGRLDSFNPWYDVTKKMAKAADTKRHFMELVEINKGRKDICFIVKLVKAKQGDLITMSITGNGNEYEFKPLQAPRIKTINQQKIYEHSNQTIEVKQKTIEVQIEEYSDTTLKQTTVFALSNVTESNSIVSRQEVKPNRNKVTFKDLKAGLYKLDVYSYSEVGGLKSKSSDFLVSLGKSTQAFVRTEKGSTCSDNRLQDLSTDQECSNAVTYAKSFNAKAVYIKSHKLHWQPKGCRIYDDGQMYFNRHPSGALRGKYEEASSICKNEDSPDGYAGYQCDRWSHNCEGIGDWYDGLRSACPITCNNV